MNPWQKARYLVFQWREVRDAIGVTRFGGLAKVGWLRSMRERASVDADGEPLPWLTYPAIDFLSRRVPAQARVFEYGCGNGTLWWARHAREVVACEHDAAWSGRIAARLPPNARVMLVPFKPGGRYSRAVQESGLTFDLVIVDGEDRVECVKQSVAGLTAGGVIVLDNSERPEYAEAFTWLAQEGFRRLDFVGLLPSVADESATTIFYRDHNCLGI